MNIYIYMSVCMYVYILYIYICMCACDCVMYSVSVVHAIPSDIPEEVRRTTYGRITTTNICKMETTHVRDRIYMIDKYKYFA